MFYSEREAQQQKIQSIGFELSFCIFSSAQRQLRSICVLFFEERISSIVADTLLKFCMVLFLFVGPMIPVFRTSGNNYIGIQIQSGYQQMRTSLPACNRFWWSAWLASSFSHVLFHAQVGGWKWVSTPLFIKRK